MRPRNRRAQSISAGRPSRSAQVNALQRAAETMQPASRRLICDPYAGAMVSSRLYRAALVAPSVARLGLRLLDVAYPGLHVWIMLRARYVEDAVAAAHAEGIGQLVLLGAGYDSTAYRDTGAPPLTVYEVDAPATQQVKLEQVARHRLEARQPVVHVSCDFESDSVVERLAGSGFDAGARSLIVWLGVSYYLTDEALARALSGVAEFSAPGSRLVFDYMDPEVIDGTTSHPGARRVARNVEKRGEPYLSGLTVDGARALLRSAGFEVVGAARVPDLVARYGERDGVWCSTEDWLGLMLAERAGGT